MDSVYSIFSISLTVVQSPFSHASLLTFLNPTDIHLVKCEPFCKWGLFWESHVSPPSLSLSLSSMHPREGCKSCCPLVMTESEEELGEKKKRKSASIGAPISPLSVCVCLFHSHSACGLLLCHPQGCIWRRPSVDPFVSCFASCATASLQSMIRPGLSPAHPLCVCQQALRARRVCCSGWDRRLCPDSDKEKW